MAFKMKAGSDGPMKKNFPSVFKKDGQKYPKNKKEDYHKNVTDSILSSKNINIMDVVRTGKGKDKLKEAMDEAKKMTEKKFGK